MNTSGQIILLAVVLGPWLLAEWLRIRNSDWPATCTPFEGEAQRWAKERQQADELAGREWGEVADLPPMSPETILKASDESFLSALDSQPDVDQIAPLRPRKAAEGETDEFDTDTLTRQAEIRKRHEAKMARLRRMGLKLDIEK